MTMVEKVARAICHASNPCSSIVEEIMEKPDYAANQEGDAGSMTLAGYYRQMARAAIAAMREPTPEMVDGWRRTPAAAGMTYDDVFRRYWWPAAIDVALTEK